MSMTDKAAKSGSNSEAPFADEGRFAYEGLDRVIHERARLSVLTSLVTNPKGLAFGDLKQLCALTDGNLNRHLKVLEEANLVEIVKKQEHNRPLTICRITASGRARYLEYLETLEQVIRDAAAGAKSEAGTRIAAHLAPTRA
jgi:DNA-binding MarR family transcriptional regulator